MQGGEDEEGRRLPGVVHEERSQGETEQRPGPLGPLLRAGESNSAPGSRLLAPTCVVARPSLFRHTGILLRSLTVLLSDPLDPDQQGRGA